MRTMESEHEWKKRAIENQLKEFIIFKICKIYLLCVINVAVVVVIVGDEDDDGDDNEFVAYFIIGETGRKFSFQFIPGLKSNVTERSYCSACTVNIYTIFRCDSVQPMSLPLSHLAKNAFILR